MADLEALALAANDALKAAHQRGWEEAVQFVQKTIDASEYLCIIISSRDGDDEAEVSFEIHDENRNLMIASKSVKFSDAVYEQYPCCKDSIAELRESLGASLVNVDKIIENWAKP